MSPEQRGAVDSGLDRALQWHQDRRLDESLLSGSQVAGDERPVRIGRLQPWQRLIGDPMDRPGATKPKDIAEEDQSAPQPGELPLTVNELSNRLHARAKELEIADADYRTWAFKPNMTGVVVVHGIGPQLAGQTLLDWTRPIISAIDDAVEADAAIARTEKTPPLLAPPDPDAKGITDPVYKSNIDFSGETFPVLQLRIPRRARETDEEKAADDPLWVFSETWWASEVRPPTLRTMVGWLGEQGGVSRIVQGLQENTFGHGRLKWAAHVSVLPFVSVIVSFALLMLIVGLAITRLIPIESIRSAAALKLASTFLTDWFGGARTLLRDPAQSANVRHRLVQTIKALRAYGCQRVVLVSHSGGTIVSLQTLTDPAYAKLHVDKLITHGEALNLGWRLESADPDEEIPSLDRGHRMLGNLRDKPRLIWRDFFGTHDPASCGPPIPPYQLDDEGNRLPDVRNNPRFTTERTYNQMSVLGDHGGYWDNDEHFVIPVLREIDVPNGGRSRSRFYTDKAESELRARRKERISFLRLLRRGTNTMPVMAILAAALLTSGGYLMAIGQAAMDAIGGLPFGGLIGSIGDGLRGIGSNGVATRPDASQPISWVYSLGLLVLQGTFLFAILQAIVPSAAGGLWYRRPVASAVIWSVDLLLGPIAFGLIMVIWLVTIGLPAGLGAILSQLFLQSSIIPVALGVAGVALLGLVGKKLRKQLRHRRANVSLLDEIARGGMLFISSLALATLLVLFVVAAFSILLVLSGSYARDAIETVRIRGFVVGSLVSLLLFNVFQRVGGWRWSSWDVRERHALRRDPLGRPKRWWVSIVGALLTAIVLLTAWLIAVGTDDASLPFLSRASWTWLIVGLVGGLVLLTIGKDVVDNDVDADGGMIGGRGPGPSPTMIEPSVQGAAAGST